MNRSASPQNDPSPARRTPVDDRLTPILERKREEIAALRPRRAELRAEAADAPPTRPWAAVLRPPGRVALIAELKRRAPSAGELNPGLIPERMARIYEEAGAAALSVLTDRAFGGELSDLQRARDAVGLPVLRKDFTLDPVQVWESRAAGADAILVIVRALEPAALKELLEVAAEAGLGTLVEVHDETELSMALDAGASVIGVNNRNLRTFTTNLEVTRRLAERIPSERILVAESGIRSAEQVRDLGGRGVDAVLVGSALVSHSEPGRLAAELVGQSRRERR